MKLALAGTPNSGKTSVFNRLTGLNQKVGNYPGVTVDKKIGYFHIGDKRAELLDLPGAYSLYPSSNDEKVLLDVLLDRGHVNYPDCVIYVVNACNLKRSLTLLTQILDLEIPVICCLNMLDLADTEGIKVDHKKLEKQLSCPVVLVNGKSGEGIENIKDELTKLPPPSTVNFYKADKLSAVLLEQAKSVISCKNDYQGHLSLFHSDTLPMLSQEQRKALQEAKSALDFDRSKVEMGDKMNRLMEIDEIDRQVARNRLSGNSKSMTDKIDAVLTHNVYGTVIFLGILFVIFQLLFAIAEYPMNWIDSGVGILNQGVRTLLPTSLLADLLCDGIIPGVGGILIFIPQIALLFGLISLLEESGYMTRAVYLSDNLMKRVGLNGRSLVALISGVACAIPAIMSTRTIGNNKERLITIFVTPFISCSARLPVFVVLTAFVVPNEYYLGIINLRGLVIMSLYLLGLFAAIGSSWLLHKFMKTKELSFLMLELPPYQWPQWKNAAISVVEKVKVFVFEAGRIILVISVILWALASYGPGDRMALAEQKVHENKEGLNSEEIEKIIAAKRLEQSYAGYLGKVIEPVIKPIGLDWKIGIALVTSFAAREVFVSTMATIYAAGSADDEQSIIERMRDERDMISGEKTYNRARSLSLLIFYVFAMQCMSTLAIVKRETKGWLIPALQLVYMTAMAYTSSYLVYHLFA